MWEKIKIILVTSLVFFICFALYQFYAPDKLIVKMLKSSGSLSVESLPKASVFLGEKLIGQTPLLTSVNSGVYRLKLITQDGNKKTLSYSKSIRVNSHALTYVNYFFNASLLKASGEYFYLEKINSQKGQLMVSTDPPGLFILFDGQERGISPLLLDNINQGEHDLTATGEGIKPLSVKVNINKGYKLNAELKLALDEEYQQKKAAAKKENKTKAAAAKKLEIKETETGWLRVRSLPSLDASESAKISSGEKVNYYNEQEGWYEIEYEKGKRGWVNGEYVEIIE